MYTNEDKVFYVKRMWAEGLTPTAASRLWGVPSRRTLAAWEKEALGGGLAVEAPRVPGACKRAKHARYPEETRAEALRLLGLTMREGGMSARGRRAGRRFSSYAGEVDGGRPANVPRERAVARREAGEDFRLAHDFSAGAPGELLVTDVTEF